MLKHQRDRIANRQHRRRAGARREAERARFFELSEFDDNGRSAADRARLRRSDRHERHVEVLERWQQLHHLACLAALREHQHDVGRMDAAQVAVKRFGRMQVVRPRAERSQRRGNLLPDDAGLAHARDDHAAFTLEQQLHGLAERFVESIRKLPNRLRFEAQDLAQARSCSVTVR